MIIPKSFGWPGSGSLPPSRWKPLTAGLTASWWISGKSGPGRPGYPSITGSCRPMRPSPGSGREKSMSSAGWRGFPMPGIWPGPSRITASPWMSLPFGRRAGSTTSKTSSLFGWEWSAGMWPTGISGGISRMSPWPAIPTIRRSSGRPWRGKSGSLRACSPRSCSTSAGPVRPAVSGTAATACSPPISGPSSGRTGRIWSPGSTAGSAGFRPTRSRRWSGAGPGSPWATGFPGPSSASGCWCW